LLHLGTPSDVALAIRKGYGAREGEWDWEPVGPADVRGS